MEGRRREMISAEMQDVAGRLEAADSEFKAAEGLLEEAIKNQGDVQEASELYDKAAEAYERAAVTYEALIVAAGREDDRLRALESKMEAEQGSLKAAMESGDAETVQAAATALAETAGRVKESVEAMPGLSEEEQDELEGLLDELGITDEKTAERMKNRMKVLLSGMETRDPEKAAAAIKAEPQTVKPRFTNRTWAGS